MLAAVPARAAEPIGEIVAQPICFDLINEATFEVLGQVRSDFYFTPDGTKAYHRSNFRLKPQEKAKICSTGPFYEGRRVNLSLRSMIPLFSCKTAMDGPVTIQSAPTETGGNKVWADCR